MSSPTNNLTKYWKKRETVEILMGKRARHPSNKQRALDDADDTSPPPHTAIDKAEKSARLPSKKQQAIDAADDILSPPNTTSKATSKRKSTKSDTPPKQNNSTKKKKATPKKQNVDDPVSVGERKIETELAAVGEEAASGECVTDVNAYVNDDDPIELAAVGVEAPSGERVMDVDAHVDDDDPIDLEEFEQEME